MDSKKQISAINVVMLLIYDIQLVKHDNKNTSILFMDVKGAYNYVLAN